MTDELSWTEVQEILYKATVDALRAFSKEHLGESFYGFAFACNADYGEVMLCLNTEDGFREFAERYPETTTTDAESADRWSIGDWAYANFNMEPPCEESWESAWADVQEAITHTNLDDVGYDVQETFLQQVCWLLIAMERNDEFRCLYRDPHFKTLVIDHDESLEDAWERLGLVRQASKEEEEKSH